MRVFDRSPADPPVEPSTYALIVGVGEYPRLKSATLRALSSAAESALAFTSWVVDEYDSGDAPLATVDLVLTRAGNALDTRFAGTESATLGNVRRAFDTWLAAVGTHPGNVAIFYFSGRALWFDKPYLLTQDFDPDVPSDPWRECFSMVDTYESMAQSQARYQLYFIEGFQDLAVTGAPPPVGHGGLLPAATAPSRREAPIIYASRPGSTHHGAPGEVAHFTSALLEVLRGAGAEPMADGSYELDTSGLTSVREVMRRRASHVAALAQDPYLELNGTRRLLRFSEPRDGLTPRGEHLP
jgi:hypothetical protein